MDVREAYEHLGLEIGAAKEEIERSFRRLTNERHPDHGGTDEAMAALNEARSTALKFLDQPTSLVSVEALKTAMALVTTRNEERQLIEQRVAKAQEQLRFQSTNKLRRYRRIAGILAACSAAAFFLGQEFPISGLIPVDAKGFAEINRSWSIGCFVIGVYGTIGAWLLTNRIDQVEQELRELEDQTGTKMLMYIFLQDILGERIHQNWTLMDLMKEISKWAEEPIWRKRTGSYGRVIRSIGPLRFGQFLVDRAQQIGLVSAHDESDQGDFVEYYKLRSGG